MRRTLALSDVYVQDDSGRLIAHGSSLCFLIPPDGGPPEPQELAPVSDQEPEKTPDPYQRPVIGEVLPQPVWDEMSGLEVMLGQIAGELPAPPIHHLTGLRPVAAAEGTTTFALPATDWLSAPPPGRLEGGVVALLAETAASTAIQTLLPPKTAYAPVDLKINFLRPALTGAHELLATGRVIHRGRSIMLADAEVVNPEGKVVAVARSSAVIRAGRPAALAELDADTTRIPE
jgi:uncharacterized protein (TIGR00369 family)